MTTAPLSSDRPEAPLFCDGLGDRVVAADGATGELLQILKVRPALTAVPSFEFALRERSARLANFRHAYYARVRRIDRIQSPAPGLAIVSDHVEGTRLSDILRVAEERGLQLDINTALCMIRQLVPAVALMHENAREVAHGLIAPERLIVSPYARLVIVEHVLGAAVEQLQFSRERLWQEFRIAMPSTAGVSRFDHRADVTGIGLVALALVLGRPLRAEEFPHRLPMLLNEARERTALGEEQPLSAPLREWLARSLQIDVRRAFASAPEALAALEELVADESTYVAAPVALETFMQRYIAALLEPLPSEVPPAAPVIVFPSPQARVAPVEEPRPEREPDAPAFDLLARLDESPAVTESSPVKGAIAPEPAAPAYEAAELSLPTAPPLAAPPAPRLPLPLAQAPVPVAAAAHTQIEIEAPSPAPVPAAAAKPVTPFVAPPPAMSAPPPPVLRDITEIIATDDLRIPAGQPRKELFEEEAHAFPADDDAPSKRRAAGSSWKKPAAIAAAIVVLGAGAYFGSQVVRGGAVAADAAMGTLDVQSSPPGIEVFVDGESRGATPAKLSVKPGSHILELRGRGVPRVIPITVAAGGQVSQYLEFADTPSFGQLHVQSPAGSKVLVDGIERGTAPITVGNLTPGDHEVVLQSAAGLARQVVNVQAGGTASLVAPAGPDAGSGPVSGWISVQAPVSVEIREAGRLLGTSDSDRVMLAAGRHDLEIVNAVLGFRTTRVVQVPAGKVAPIKVDLPSGVVNLNAAPWAEVWIDGQRVGETPIGNLSVPIGSHEVVFKNPQLGEKKHAISVTLGAPVRLSVDMK